MRRLASLLIMIALSVALTACNCCRPTTCCQTPTSIAGNQQMNMIAPRPNAIGAQCTTWPNYRPTANDPYASVLLAQIRANADLWYQWAIGSTGHSNACGSTCQNGWGVRVWNEAYACEHSTGQHSDAAAGNDHYDMTCAELYSDVQQALAKSTFTGNAADAPNWQGCLFELNHEDGPMVPPQ